MASPVIIDARSMPGSFWINLQTRTETTNQAINSVLAEMKTIREAPVSDQELADAKVIFDGQLPLTAGFYSEAGKSLGTSGVFWVGVRLFQSVPKMD